MQATVHTRARSSSTMRRNHRARLRRTAPTWALVFFGILAALAAFAQPEARADSPKQAGTCGGPGQPPCPLQAFMRSSIAAPLASNNGGALANGLDKVSRIAPDPSWTSWATIASQGAAAARRGDIAGARAACKACHEAWRSQYKAKYRMRPVPP